MEEKRIRIKISDIFNNLGKCENPIIEFEQGSGYLQPCEGDDYIEIIPIGEIEGLAVWIKCEDCDICGWKKITLTPCDTDMDCEDCAVCNPSGYCVYVCKDDEVCDDGKCVECDSEHPCSGGKICVDGKCQCPANKPFWNGKECRACLNDEECGNCFKCTSDGCKPKDCICNPATGDCVECMNSGDCKDKDPNACCNSNTHKCECCDGYTKNYETGLCEKSPECYIDSDCNDLCEYCDNGRCKPIKCPEGYTCYKGDCVKICDCNKGGCPDGFTCIPYGDVCICVECIGDCVTSDDCDTGCLCGNLKKCIPNPCQGNCEDGTDCGEGCGCDPITKTCVPCSDKDCVTDECDSILGCGCDGSKCEDSDGDCSGSCDTYRDCAGKNCTCIDGQCVSCDNFPCENGLCDSVPGCECENNKDCVGSNKDCSDKFTFEKDGCGAKISLDLKEKCSCKDIVLKSYLSVALPLPPPNPPTSTPMDAKWILELRKNVVGFPMLGDTTNENIGNNELPLEGVVQFKIRYYLEDHNTRFDTGYVDESPINFNLSGKDKVEYSYTLLDIGSSYDGANDVTKSETIVTVVDDIKLGNGCIYKKGDVLFNSVCSDYECKIKNGMTYETKIISKTFTDPLLKIFRTKGDSFTTPFRKLYKTPVSLGKYLDNLHGAAKFTLGKQALVPDEGLLFGNQSYMATNDCSCEQFSTLGKVVNCEPTAISYQLSDCNSKIELNGFTPQCSTNKDLSWYDASSEDINYSQAYWKLFLNANEVATFRFYGDPATGEVKDINTNQTISGWVYTNSVPIEKIEFKMYYGNELVCDNILEKIANNIPNPNNSNTCPAVTSTVYYNMIDKVGNGLTVVSVSAKDSDNNSVYVEDTGTKFKVHAPFGKTTTVRVEYNTGCVKTYDIEEDCCGSFNVTANATLAGANCGGDLSLSGNVVGGAKSVDYVWTTPDGQTLNGLNHTLTEYVNGTYTLEAEDENGCKASDTVDVNVLDIEFYHSDNESVCDGGDAEIELTGTNGAVIEYRVDTGATQTVTLPATITVPNVTANKIVTYLTKSYGGCTKTINETTILTVVTNATASIDGSVSTQQCLGSGTPFVPLTGTPNVTVDYKINNISGQTLLNASGNGSINLPNAAGSYLVELTKATLGECVNNLSDNETILVQDSPTIVVYSNSYVCSSAGGGSFQYEVEFEANNYTGTPTSSLGTVSNISGDLWKVSNIPSGASATISVTNGTCITTQDTQAYNCDCNAITVPPPVAAQSTYTFCTGAAVPTLTVTLDTSCTNCKADWYDAAVGGTLVQGNSLTYTPSAPGAGTVKVYYVETVDLDSGCSSTRTEVWLEESELPNSTFTANSNNSYCKDSVVQFSVPYESQVTYLWKVTNGTIQGSDTGTGITVLEDTIGVMTVKLTATNVDGCVSSYSLDYDIGEITYSVSAYDCGLNKSVLTLGGVVGHTYTVVFTNKDDGFIKTLTGVAGGSNTDVTGLTDGDYDISIIDESGNGCETYDTNVYTVSCCALSWGATAVLTTEGCYTDANGDPLHIDISNNTEVYNSYNLYIEYYINDVKIKSETYLDNNSCTTFASQVTYSDLNFYPNILTQTGNVLKMVYKENNTSGSVIWQDNNVLTFDANNCA